MTFYLLSSVPSLMMSSPAHNAPLLCQPMLPCQIRDSFCVPKIPCPYLYHSTSVSSVQSLSCVRLCNPMNRSTPGLPVHHQLPEFTQTHVHRVGDAIQPSYPLSSPSPPAPNPSQHQGLFQWVNASHEVAKDPCLKALTHWKRPWCWERLGAGGEGDDRG